MKEELKREKEENSGIIVYDVYKTATGLYLSEEMCQMYNIGDRKDYRTLREKLCYKITESDLQFIDQQSKYQDIKLIPNIVTIFDLQLVLSFTVYVDTKHDNKLYILNNLCAKYGIFPKSKRIIDGITYCNVTEDDIEKVEEDTKKEKIILKRKYIEVSLEDEIKPAEYLFIYYYDFKNKKSYIQRDMYELIKMNKIEIEGEPRIIGNRNCYSITEKQLREVEVSMGYRGIEQLIKPAVQLDIPPKEQVQEIVDLIKNVQKSITIPRFEKPTTTVPKKFVIPKEITQNIKKQYVIPKEFTPKQPLVIPVQFTKGIKCVPTVTIPKEFTRPRVVVIPAQFTKDYKKKIVIPAQYTMGYNQTKKVMIPAQYTAGIQIKSEENNTTNEKPIVIYENKRNHEIYIPVNVMDSNNTEIVTIMHKECYKTGLYDLENLKDKKVVIAGVFPVEKVEYNVIICNNNGQLFISRDMLESLGFYIENPHRIIVNKEIYEEITEDDIELIQDKESDSCHINIIVKQIAPKRG